ARTLVIRAGRCVSLMLCVRERCYGSKSGRHLQNSPRKGAPEAPLAQSTPARQPRVRTAQTPGVGQWLLELRICSSTLTVSAEATRLLICNGSLPSESESPWLSRVGPEIRLPFTWVPFVL